MKEQSRTIGKVIETGANIAVLVAALLAALFFWKNSSSNSSNSSNSLSRPQISTGSTVNLKDVQWAAGDDNLVLALSTGCHFCLESGPFYRQLVQESRKNNIHTIAIFPQTVSEGDSYLKKLGIAVDEVHQESFKELQIRGTPTLLLVNHSGQVKSVWVGKLDQSGEKQVRAALRL